MKITSKDIEHNGDSTPKEEHETTIVWDYKEKTVTFFTTRIGEIRNLVDRVLEDEIVSFKDGGNNWTLVTKIDAFGHPYHSSKKRK